ncbi:hypothetical protein [Pseudohongiella spirulinae]|uniref:Lipoprotein n=1 Tax=Pseudohongiella spirulinae TaxID=1249552 RepID=A0A0S2KB81_9GAMM|nr:hypothetical protein [Pseudohongiella spirulinae]ALO45569.1 hypothetical protein PS2015_899 [Pseudohongiella spirulinae]
MLSKRLIAGMALLSLAACQSGYTPQPRATLFPASEQSYMRSAAHWDILAANEASAISQAVDDSNLLSIRSADVGDSPFEQAYRNMLLAHLVGNNVQVALDPASASHHIDYDIQVVRHENRRSLRPRPGTASAAFAIGVFGANVRNWTDQELALIPVGLGLDLLNVVWRDTEESVTEVVVNSRLHDGNRIIAADSRVYYFNAQDEHNYQGQGRQFQVVSSEQGE